MNDYVPKPFTRPQLLSALSRHYRCPEPEEEMTQAPEPVAAVVAAEPAAVFAEGRITDMTFLRNFTEGNEERIRKYVQLYLKSTPANLQKIEQALENKDYRTVSGIVHAMKPHLHYMGIRQGHQWAESIEHLIAEEAQLEQLPALVKSLREVCSRSYEELA